MHTAWRNEVRNAGDPRTALPGGYFDRSDGSGEPPTLPLTRESRSLIVSDEETLISMPARKTMVSGRGAGENKGRMCRLRIAVVKCASSGVYVQAYTCTRRSLRSPLFAKSGSLTSFILSPIDASGSRLLWLRQTRPLCSLD